MFHYSYAMAARYTRCMMVVMRCKWHIYFNLVHQSIFTFKRFVIKRKKTSESAINNRPSVREKHLNKPFAQIKVLYTGDLVYPLVYAIAGHIVFMQKVFK